MVDAINFRDMHIPGDPAVLANGWYIGTTKLRMLAWRALVSVQVWYE